MMAQGWRTARNFVGSYFDKERLITVQYPEERSPLPENYRNFPFLVFDGDDPKRVALRGLQDLREGMSAAVHLHRQERRQEARLHGQAAVLSGVFDIDISVCMSCQICVEVCPFEAIKMDKVFELSRRERFDALLMRKQQRNLLHLRRRRRRLAFHHRRDYQR
jgi:NADH-quinone oxidoreductase subunit I